MRNQNGFEGGNMQKSTKLKELISGKKNSMSYIIEAHDGLSAKIVENCGGEAIWASGFTISTAAGVRDANELSWQNILYTLENMSLCTSIPILVDGDTGYGNFNNARIFVKKLCTMGVAGVVFEDKLFPKMNSFSNSKHELANINEFCGKLKASKDTQTDADFCVVARTEAFISKCGLEVALERAHAYVDAGADAIVVHSKANTPAEILGFCKEWNKRKPVIIIPTTYEPNPPEQFKEAGVSCMIFANQLMRAAIPAMKSVCSHIIRQHSVKDFSTLATVDEIFSLVNMQELEEAEQKYLGDI